MTREEAIKILTETQVVYFAPNGKEKVQEALDMAIEALKERPQGKWIDKGMHAECSICGAHSRVQFDGIEPIPLKTSFCHNCGADMKGSDNK